ncbi:MAG: hypothetical protein HY304_07210 [candidate division Zixibacteria bacterium]|nr:hypothetical protein [candidate division Zixibacteria bacterium]
MDNTHLPDDPDGAIGDVVEAVRALGERARFLAVNLAVATAKLKQMHVGGTRLNEDLLDLVARVTRASHEVTDAVAAIEQGIAKAKPASPAMWGRWHEIGVPDEKTLERLGQSLNETLDLARHVFRWVRQVAPGAGPITSWNKADPSWADDGTEAKNS